MDCSGRLIVEATVINVGEGPYYYPACKQCYSKLIGQNDNFCPKCRKVTADTELNQRYRLRLTISDGLSLANITVFGNVLMPYFGCSAKDFHAKTKWKGQFSLQVTSSLLKSALEKTMIGSSLLFGFKGIVRKTKGSRVTLKDIESLRHSTPWNKDLVAFQVLPQCDSQYPIPVIQHLQNVDNYIQSHKENFDASTSNHDIACMLLDIENSKKTTHEESMPESSYQDSDVGVSKFLLSSAESEVSIGLSLSMTHSCSVENSFNLSEDDSLQLIEDSYQQIDSKPPKLCNLLNQEKSLDELISSPLRKQSWCVKNWLRKRKDFGNDFMAEKKSCTSAAQNTTSGSFGLLSTPEQARDISSNNFSSSNLFSNFSSLDIISSPLKCDKTQFKSPFNILASKELEKCESNLNLKTNKRRNFLTLKSNNNFDGELQSYNNSNEYLSISKDKKKYRSPEKGMAFNSTCRASTKFRRRNMTVSSCRLSFTELPESEDFDLFMAAVESEASRCKVDSGLEDVSQIKMNVPCSLPKECNGFSATDANKSKSNFNNDNLINCHDSFINVPESEDFDLFIAAVNLEQLHQGPQSSKASAENANDNICVDDGIISAQNVIGEEKELTPMHPLSLNSSTSKEMRHELFGGGHSTIKMIDHQELSGSPGSFDDSCDLFESPARSQDQSKITAMNDTRNFQKCVTDLNGESQSNLKSLFSSSPSSQKELINPENHKPDAVEILQQQSYCNESFMDLFSPVPNTLLRQREQSCNRNSFTSSSNDLFYCSSPDLFLSP